MVAKKPRNRGTASQARAAAAAAGQAGPGQAGPGPTDAVAAGPVAAGAGQAGTAQLTAPAATGTTAAYPGQRFGLPERGPMSMASMPRRLLALLIDWLLSMVIAYWLTHSQFWTIAVFSIETYVLTALTGSTVGKRLLGIRVIRTGGGPVGFRWALVRTAILLTVVPPLLTDRDLRGLHDRAADTMVVRV